MLARSACANPSSFARYAPGTGPRLAHSSACASICFAITSLPTESFRLSAGPPRPQPADGAGERQHARTQGAGDDLRAGGMDAVVAALPAGSRPEADAWRAAGEAGRRRVLGSLWVEDPRLGTDGTARVVGAMLFQSGPSGASTSPPHPHPEDIRSPQCHPSAPQNQASRCKTHRSLMIGAVR